MWITCGYLVIPVLAATWANLRPGRVLTWADAVYQLGCHLLLLVPLGIVELLLTWVVSVQLVEKRGLHGLDYLPGGAAISLIAGGIGASLVCLLIGLCALFIVGLRDVAPLWMRLMGLPMLLLSIIFMAIGGVLGVDTGDARRLGLIYRALFAQGEVLSEGWLLTSRASIVLLIVSVLILWETGRRAARLPD
jgi:hypothetical protein